MIKIFNIRDIRCLDCYAFFTDITVTQILLYSTVRGKLLDFVLLVINCSIHFLLFVVDCLL